MSQLSIPPSLSIPSSPRHKQEKEQQQINPTQSITNENSVSGTLSLNLEIETLRATLTITPLVPTHLEKKYSTDSLEKTPNIRQKRKASLRLTINKEPVSNLNKETISTSNKRRKRNDTPPPSPKRATSIKKFDTKLALDVSNARHRETFETPQKFKILYCNIRHHKATTHTSLRHKHQVTTTSPNTPTPLN